MEHYIICVINFHGVEECDVIRDLACSLGVAVNSGR